MASSRIAAPLYSRYPEYNLTYRSGVRIQHLWPRSYIPFLESQSEQKYFIYLHLEGAQRMGVNRCRVPGSIVFFISSAEYQGKEHSKIYNYINHAYVYIYIYIFHSYLKIMIPDTKQRKWTCHVPNFRVNQRQLIRV